MSAIRHHSSSNVIRVATYRRVATPKPSSDVSSLEAQDYDLSRHIAGKADNHWVTKPEWSFYEQASGGKRNQPELEKLLALVKRKEVDIVLVKSIDRLARSHKCLNEIFEVLRHHGVDLVSVKDGIESQQWQRRFSQHLHLPFTLGQEDHLTNEQA